LDYYYYLSFEFGIIINIEGESFLTNFVDSLKFFKQSNKTGEPGLGKSHLSNDEEYINANKIQKDLGNIKLLRGGKLEPFRAELSNFTLTLTKENSKLEKVIYNLSLF
jgi:hypothetical protein